MNSMLDLSLPDGTCDAYVAAPGGNGPFPAVIIAMDGLGLRPVLKELADRLAGEGHYVLVPNLFYRAGRAPVADPRTVLAPENRTRLVELINSLTPDRILADGRGFVGHLVAAPAADQARIGIVGYCMGGGIALRLAAHFPQLVKAAASFHGANLATDAPTSPHLMAFDLKAEVHVGLAQDDPTMPQEQIDRLVAAFDKVGVNYTIEDYPGRHGFAMADHPAYDAQADARHWERLTALLRRTLAA